MDKKLPIKERMDQLAEDLQKTESTHREQIAAWLMANQLRKSKKTLNLLGSWEKAKWPILRRLFWYHQARLRWSDQTPPENTEE